MRPALRRSRRSRRELNTPSWTANSFAFQMVHPGHSTLIRYPALQMALDCYRISALLREHLIPLEEK